MSLEQSEKKRVAARGWLTRAIKRLDIVIQETASERIDFEQAIEEVNKRIATLEDVQSEVESFITKAEMLEADIENASQYFDKAMEIKIVARKKLSKLIAEDDDSLSTSTSVNHNTARLPKIELPKFKGDVTQWKEFLDQFSATIDESNIPVVTKFTYLKGLLEDEAKATIDGLSLTNSHYKIACEILQERYGRKELIVFSHIQGLLSLKPDEKFKDSLSKLKSMLDQVNIHVRSLEALGFDGSTYGILLTPVILSRLPSDVRMEWAKEGRGKEGNLDFLLNFLQQEIERRERADTFNLDHYEDSQEERKLKPRRIRPGTATALYSHEVDQLRECVFCKKSSHTTDKCWTAKKMTVEERKRFFVDSNVCFKCSLPGHSARSCRRKCEVCKGNHHRWLCFTNTRKKSEEKHDVRRADKEQPCYDETPPNVSLIVQEVSQNVVLQIVKVTTVQGPQNSKDIYALFDSGSDKSYVTKDLVKKLKLKPVAYVNQSYAVFGGGKSAEERRSVVRFNMKSHTRNYEVQALEVPVICAPLERPRIAKYKLEKWGIPVAEGYYGDRVKLDMLIGLDYYWKLMLNNVIRIEGENLVAQESVFGFVLSGSLNQKNQSDRNVSPQLLVLNNLSEAGVRRFWEVEHIGILSEEMIGEDEVLRKFNETIEYEDGRYLVSLPWKIDKREQLKDNKDAALHRTKKLDVKLSKDPNLKEEYNEIFREWEKTGIIEEVPENEESNSSNPIFYLPHRPVVRRDKLSTKVRPVFDASAKTVHDISLNDCLHTGPNMLPDLVAVLIRFRRHKIALNADISKAFLQIMLKKEDRDVHRFLWMDGQRTRKMRFCRVTFGVKSSPFLLNATIKYHLKLQPESLALKELEENLYMDDWLSGADESDVASQMYKMATSIMNGASMNLTKWRSSEREILENDDPESGKVLGIRWSDLTDTFMFDGIAVPEHIIVTKRIVLSILAKIFDPLGFLAPVIMTGKILFQKLWRLGIDWDEEVPPELATEFRVWIANLEHLKTLDIPRSYSKQQWKDLENNAELQVFADASNSGYGAVIYLVTPGEMDAMFVISKARVSPLKKITLPRLELLACLLAARLLLFVKNALKKTNLKYTCYSDSQIALAWIKGDPFKYKQFIANRIQEIQCLTDPRCWKHISGKQNPADLLTRGLKAQVLSEGMWFKGSPNLNEHISDDIIGTIDIPIEETCARDIVFNSVSIENVKLLEVERWSSLNKAVRIVQHVLKFIKRLKIVKEESTSRNNEEDVFEEAQESGSHRISEAERHLIKQEQGIQFADELKFLMNGKERLEKRSSKIFKLSPFLDGELVLRVKGRLQRAELAYSRKHPIILDKSWFAKLIVRDCHERMNHAGVDTMITNIRNQFWIIGLRRLAKSVVHDCISCQKVLAKTCNQTCAPLPRERLVPGLPFDVTGVDYAGPVFVLDSPEKFYVCLFTCAKIRAIHLELSNSLSTNDFFLSFRRFVARRTLPAVIFSDNAKTFKSAEGKMKIYGRSAPRWKFIVPRAPWWGGWWERMVRNVKSALKKCLGSTLVTKDELVTLLMEIENTVNSRPLTQVTDEVDDDKPITPNDFLGSKSVIYGKNLVDIHESRMKLLSMFWKIWSTSYLQNLPKIVPHFKEKGNIPVGSLVLVQDDNVRRLQWPLGQVIETLVSGDGKIRSAKVKTAKSCLIRPVQRLCQLEGVCRSPSKLDFEVANLPSPVVEEKKLKENEPSQQLKKTVIVKYIDSSEAPIISLPPKSRVEMGKATQDVSTKGAVTSRYGRVITKNSKYAG